LSANSVVVASVNSFGTNGGDAFTLTFNDQATNAIVQETLQSMRYSPASYNPGTDPRTITVTATDSAGASSVDTRTIEVTSVNDPPNNAGDLPFTASANMAEASRIDFSNMRVNDPDSGSATVTFTFVASIGTITATMDSAADYSVTVGGSGTDTVTIAGTIADIDKYFDATADGDWFLYTGPAGVSGTDAARITVSANDGGNSGLGGGADIAFGFFDIDIVIPNSLPTSENTAVTATEDQEYVFKEADFTFADADAGATLNRITLSNISLASGDKLVYRESGENDVDVTDNYNIFPSDLSDGYLVYIPQADANGNARSSFHFTVRDNEGGVSSSSYTLTINVTDVAEPIIPSDPKPVNLAGSNGNDTLSGNDADDTIAGGAGDDMISGEAGRDTLSGADGEDTLSGGSGNDEVWAGAGNDSASGDGGGDKVGGGTGDDTLNGGAGDDTLYGGEDADILIGSGGNDLIFNGLGNDAIDGGSGNDTLWGGAGNDTLTGGAGADNFVFGALSGDDTITDFSVTDDTLDLRFAAVDFTSLADVQAAASLTSVDGTAGVLIDLGGGNSVFIEDLTLTDLTSLDLTV